MQKIYLTVFEIMPVSADGPLEGIEGGQALSWIKANDTDSVFAKSQYLIERSGFSVIKIESPPIEVRREHFIGKEDGTAFYDEANRYGQSIAFSVWGNSFDEPTKTRLKIETGIDVGKLWKEKKKLSQKGRCLHFNSGEQCNKIIKAHSVQRNQSLSAIAEKGHVYQLSDNASYLQAKGKSIYTKVGINKATTFLGFCKHHDNTLFAPIDDHKLEPTEQQALLYGYRSLCRELFVKQNAHDLIHSILKDSGLNPANEDFFKNNLVGIKIGLSSLLECKRTYDKTLANARYDQIRYVVFCNTSKPVIAFSGLLFPHYDFQGREIQNLIDSSTPSQIITFCSAPMATGWGVVFAWHEEHDESCAPLIASLATEIHDKQNAGDTLFRFVMSSCENLVFRPPWWEALPGESKKQIEETVMSQGDPLSAIQPSYLSAGLEGIITWDFQKVISNFTRKGQNCSCGTL